MVVLMFIDGVALVISLSLEEDSLFRLGLRFEKFLNPVSDLFASLLEFFGVTCVWSVELSAVATVVAVRDNGDLSEPWLRLLLGGPSPWVFTTVGKEDLGSCNAHSALVDSVRPSLWSLVHLHAWEASFAHCWPVVQREVWRTHWVLLAGSLEPSVFRAVLVGPRPGRTIHVDCGVCDDSCVVVWGICSLLGSVRDHGLYELLLA